MDPMPTIEDKKAAILENIKSLNPQDQQAIIDQACLRSPTQKASDTLWFIIVVSFAIVLVGTFVSIAIGVLFNNTVTNNNAGLQILVTLFTGAVGFLGGLLTPGPNRNQPPAH